MKLSSLVAGFALASSLLPASALVVQDNGSYTLSYEETSDLGYLASWFGSSSSAGFHWAFNDAIKVVSVGGALETLSVSLPSFTVTANAGYTLSDLNAFIGKLAFTEVSGNTTGILAYADVEIDGVDYSISGGGIGWVITDSGPSHNIGYFASTSSLPGTFNTITVSNVSLVLSAAGGAFGSIQATDQNKLEISFGVTAVPEPETYAMLLAGLGVVGWVAAKRRRRD